MTPIAVLSLARVFNKLPVLPLLTETALVFRLALSGPFCRSVPGGRQGRKSGEDDAHQENPDRIKIRPLAFRLRSWPARLKLVGAISFMSRLSAFLVLKLLLAAAFSGNFLILAFVVPALNVDATVGWLIPTIEGETWLFSEIDVARAQPIQDLKTDMGVNDEGIPIALDLFDQLYGVRRTLSGISSAIAARDELIRRRILAKIRGAPLKPAPLESNS